MPQHFAGPPQSDPPKIAVITVSDRCARGLREDVSGPLAAGLLGEFGDVGEVALVPDSVDAIRRAILGAIEGGARVVFTTGGTGITSRDVTPEATAGLVTQRMPGVENLLRDNPRVPGAAISRGVAGVVAHRGARAFVLNAPGSPGGVRDAVGAIGPRLAHIVDQLDDGDHLPGPGSDSGGAEPGCAGPGSLATAGPAVGGTTPGSSDSRGAATGGAELGAAAAGAARGGAELGAAAGRAGLGAAAGRAGLGAAAGRAEPAGSATGGADLSGTELRIPDLGGADVGGTELRIPDLGGETAADTELDVFALAQSAPGGGSARAGATHPEPTQAAPPVSRAQAASPARPAPPAPPAPPALPASPEHSAPPARPVSAAHLALSAHPMLSAQTASPAQASQPARSDPQTPSAHEEATRHLQNRGRSDGSDAAVAWACVSAEPIDVESLAGLVDDPGAGAVVTFRGQVRNHDEARQVTAIEYEAHPRAGEVIREVAEAAGRGSGACKIAVAHRTGRLVVGDVALGAAVSASHRAEALRVLEDLIEAVKMQLPVWKKQIFADGTSQWSGRA